MSARPVVATWLFFASLVLGPAHALQDDAGAVREAEELIRAGSYRQAAELLQAESSEPSPARDALLGRALALDRRYLAAESPLRRAVEGGRRDLETYFYFGSTLWENGKAEEAEVVYRAALAASGDHPAFLQQLGRLLLWKGDYESAADLLARAMAAAPRNLDLALDYARALEGGGREKEALASYRAIASQAPDLPEGHYGLGRLLVAAGDLDGGRRELEIFRRLQEAEQQQTLETGRRRAEVDQGRALIRAGDFAGAVEHLSALLPTPEQLDALALALRLSGRREEAVAALEKAVAMAPERSDLRARLTEVRLATEAPPGNP